MHAPFRRAVLEALHRDVPAARPSPTASWPRAPATRKAARAAGTACARNPVPIVVPCHRVLPGTGGIGNYGGGPERKRALLALEGVLGLLLTLMDLMTTGSAGWPVSGSAWMPPILSTTSSRSVTLPSSA